MSLMTSLAIMQHTMIANNAAMNMFGINNTRMGLLSQAANPSFGSLESLHAMDTQLELDMITNSLQYKMSKAMLEQLEKQQKEDSKRFNVFA